MTVRRLITVLTGATQPLVRCGLRELFRDEEGFRVLAAGTSVRTCLAAATRLRPNVVVLDLGPRPGPADLVDLAGLARRPGLRLVVLADEVTRSALAGLVRAAAVTVVERDGDPVRLRQVVRLAARCSPAEERTGRGLGSTPFAGRGLGLPPLTRRELEVLELLGRGASNSAVAEDLGVSVSTAKFHVRGLLKKLQARNRTDVAVLAVRHGLV